MNRVLIVDDDPDVRELYSVALSEAGFDILQAADGVGAIAAYHANSPDLVLLDIGLGAGSIDGLEVCRRLRAVTDTPIVLLTSRDEEIDQLTGLHVGADDYLTKPISLACSPPRWPRCSAAALSAAATIPPPPSLRTACGSIWRAAPSPSTANR